MKKEKNIRSEEERIKKEKAAKDHEDKLLVIMREMEEYNRKLKKEVQLCLGEALRALARFKETGEMEFRINGEAMDVQTFLLTLNKILNFDVPVIGIRTLFTMSRASIIAGLKENNRYMVDHLQSIRGARKPEMPEICKKIEIDTVVNITG